MAITEVNLPKVTRHTMPWVRRLEAAGFRAWPAASVRYDGALTIRLNAGLPAKRLNSINALDGRDNRDLERRLGAAARAFEAYGRPMVVRQTPLMPPEIIDHCRADGWTEFDHSLVMKAPMTELDFGPVVDRVPLKDIAQFVESAIEIGAVGPAYQAGLSEVIHSIVPEAGLFVIKHEGQPAACCICVRDGTIAGLFEIATAEAFRRQGFGRSLMLSALKWAASRGAHTAWLQVVSANNGAIGLYHQLGFEAVYGYSYWQKLADAQSQGVA